MAGKPKRMSQIKQLLKLHKQGKGKRAIARTLEISKNTVKTYLTKVEQGDMDVDALLSLEDPALDAVFFAGDPSYKDDRYQQLKNQFGYFQKELKRTGVTRTLLWQEYAESTSDSYSYTQFCHHLNQYLTAQNPSMVLHHNAGDKLYIDFAGNKLSYVDRTTGEIIECQVFVACLPYSDYCFAIAVHSQAIEDFIYALSLCLKGIGGVPLTLVPDNLKSAIVKANRYEPTVNRALEDFANHYGTTVTPTRARKPKDKALVENQVKLIYSRVYAKLRNLVFFDLPSLNRALGEKVRDHNQTRMQHKDYCREEKFLSDEKHTLGALPQQEFEIKYYKELKVMTNNHIQMYTDKNYYSVPYTLIGTSVNVIYTRSMVKIYSNGKMVAVHQRSYSKGKYTSQEDHLCSQHCHYLSRSPEYYMGMAKKQSDTLYRLIELVFTQDKYPEQLYRSCDGLLSLCRKTEKTVFDKACLIAIDHEVYSYGFIVNILQNKMTIETETLNKPSLPKHDNTRGSGYYR